MLERKQQWLRTCRYGLLGLLATVCLFPAEQAASQALKSQMGTVKSIAGEQLSLSTDKAQVVLVDVAANAKIVKLPAASKDMKDAQPLQMKDVAVGDRILVRGGPGADATSFVASMVVVMKDDDIQQKRQKEQQDWQKRGTGGLVSSVYPVGNAITISSGAAAEVKKTIIHVSGTTVVRRYAPDSVRFEDAQLSTLAQVKPGDQLRARGTRTPEGSLDAEEIVSGSFRNVAGTVVKVDPAGTVLTIKDTVTQKPIEIKISADSQLRRLPAMAAQMIARRASGGEAAGGQGGPGQQAGSRSPATPRASGAGADVREADGTRPPRSMDQAGDQAGGPAGAPANASESRSSGGMRGEMGGREAPDLAQVVSTLPRMPVADLHPGDAVMIVSTPGLVSSDGTVITLLAGVEPILAATAKGGQAMTLSPWSLSSGGPGGDALQ